MVSMVALVSELVTVTFAFGMTDPDGSVTIPMTRPVASCAAKGSAQRTTSANKAKICHERRRAACCMLYPSRALTCRPDWPVLRANFNRLLQTFRTPDGGAKQLL